MISETIELKPSSPFCSTAELNRLARQQGLCLAIAQAFVLDQICQAIKLDSEVEEALVHEYLNSLDIGNDDQLAKYLHKKQWTHDDLLYFSTKGRRITLFKQKAFRDELEVYFLDRKLDFDQVEYSLIRVSDQNLAFELHQRLIEGEGSFSELASAYSEGQERMSDGRVGPLSLTTAHPEVAELLRTCQPGQICAPKFLVDVWLIIRLDKRIGAQLDEERSQVLLNELFDDWLSVQVQELLEGSRSVNLPLHLLHD